MSLNWVEAGGSSSGSKSVSLISSVSAMLQRVRIPRRLNRRARGLSSRSAEVLENRLLLFALGARWSTTATNGSGLSQGDATTVTWSIVPDGTPIGALSGVSGESSDPSNLVAFLNGIYGTVTNDTNYTDEIWFPHFQSTFDRWSELSGITYVYVPYDDGATFAGPAGVLGVRADVRIGGHRIDGNSGVLAYNFYPNNGEMVIDTADTNYPSTGNSIRLRNVLAHESGHGLGLRHVISSNAAFLMEGNLSQAFDGPQFDDILGLQRHYGDFYEKNGGNDTAANATPLGSLSSGQTLTIGADAHSTAVSVSMTDFVSIDDESDIDFFSFTVSAAGSVSINLTPMGPTYLMGPQGGSESSFNAAAQNDLTLTLFDRNGSTILVTANNTGLGGSEAINGYFLPAAGTYYARVTGSTLDKIQMYQLDISSEAPASPELSIADVTVSESAGTATFTVSLNTAAGTDVSFNYATSNNTALAVSDYISTSGSRTIPAGQTSTSFTVQIVDDNLHEATETFFVTISSPVGAAIARATATGTITDNDALALSVSVNPGSFSETAGSSAATGTVTRNSADLSSSLVVNLSSSDTTEATVSSSVTIPAGQASATFTIAAVDDAIVDGSQSVTITAAASSHVSGTANVTVTDNDVLTLTLSVNPGTFSEAAGSSAATGTVTRNSADLSSSLVVNLSSSDTTEAAVQTSVIIPAGQASATFAIAAVDDAVVDGSQTVTMTAAAASYVSGTANVTVTDNDVLTLTLAVSPGTFSEGAGSLAATGTVTRNSADLSSSLVVNLSSSDTTEATVPTTVTIPAGQSSATFSIAAVDDALVDGSQLVTITAGAASYVSGTANVTVTDNDSLALTVTVSPGTFSEAAGASAATGTVTRNTADLSSSLVVNLSSSDTTEATTPATVTIPAGQASATFTIAAVDDVIVDGTQSVTITAAATAYTSGTANVTVTDNDVLTLTVTVSPGTFSEAAGSSAATGTVTRNSANLSSSLVVNLSSSDTTEATVPTTVTIPAGQSSATFAIAAVDDVIVDGNQSVTISATATSYVTGTANITVTDNDGLALTVTVNPGTFSEAAGASAATGTVIRNSADLSSSLVVNLSSSDTTEATVPATVTIPAGQTSATFTITAVDDTLVDGSQSVTITAAAASYATGTANVTVTDNDVLTLTLTVSPGTFSEGAGSQAATGTVTRNSANLSASLLVNLSSSDTTEAAVPTTVTIPAGQSSASFLIAAVDDAIVDGSQSVTITAAASSYVSGTASVTVTDNDSPALTVTVNPGTFSEAAGASAATGTVTRNSANLSSSLVVNLSSSDTTEATVPTTVTIPAGQASATFTIAAVDDAIVDGSQSVTITAAAASYASGTANVTVTDNDVLTLTLTVSPGTFSEAAGSSAATGTVTRNSADLSSSLVVNLSSSDTTEATVPTSVIIPAGQASATFGIAAVDDAIVDGSQSVTITAAATSYVSGTTNVTVTDNDVLTLTLAVSPGTFSEGAGSQAATGTVTRNSANLSSSMVVNLSSSDTTEASVPATVTIAAGQSSATFSIAAVDDAIVDGSQSVTISASATSYVTGTANVTVTDNDSLALTVTVTPGTFSEGAGGTAATGTVTRNGEDLSASVVVNLSSSDTTEATVPATVTIPAGQSSATFPIAAVDDTLVDGSQSVTITAASASYVSGIANVTVTDNDVLTLTLAVSPGTFSEAAGSQAATGTVTRNSADLNSSLVVNLSSSDTSEAAVPSSVIIPAGQASATFLIAAVDDAIVDGSQVVTISSAAAGYVSGAANVTVTDNDVLATPVISQPGSKVGSQRPEIVWSESNGATLYEVWIANQSTGENPYYLATVAGTSHIPEMDLGIGVFNLWVRARNDIGVSAWTSQHQFRIQGRPLIAPGNRFQESYRPTLDWEAVPGAVRYDVWIDDHSAGISQYIRNQNVIGNSFTPATDLPLGLYRAWVRAIAADGLASDWSIMQEYYVIPAPVITQGMNSTFDRTPTFAWEPSTGAVRYEVFIRNQSTGQVQVYDQQVMDTSWTASVALADGPYRWWALAVGANNVRSYWTEPMDIYIGGRSQVLTPVGSTNQTTPTFTWNEVDGAVRYELWVDRVGVQVAFINETQLTGTSFTPSTVLPAGNYRSWVRAVSATNEFSPWSVQLSFTIVAESVPESDAQGPVDQLLAGLFGDELEQHVLVKARSEDERLDDVDTSVLRTERSRDVRVSAPAVDSYQPSGAQLPDLSDLTELWMNSDALLNLLTVNSDG